MTIAVVNGFPCRPNTAEVEYIKRFIMAAHRLGHQAYEVVTSDDIHACQPDFVLATHEFTPKLTPYFTVGAMWSPPSFFARDKSRIRSILSYDGYLVGSAQVGEFIDALEYSTGVRKPRSDFLFLPTSLSTPFKARPPSRDYELAYIGVHWDGLRHNGLLARLEAAGKLNVYGPPDSWNDYPKSYRGTVPFDGEAVLETLARHGIALCLHKEDHRRADTPSMRLFEAAAAGCLIIADDIPFARRILGDCAFYIDLNAPTKDSADRVIEIIEWANQNPELASAMAARSHAILRDAYSLETSIQNCCDFVSRCKAEQADSHRNAIRSFVQTDKAYTADDTRRPIVDIIVRTGGRHLSTLRRALRSIAAQTEGYYRVLLVDYKGRDDVSACAAEESTSRLEVRYMRCADTGLRSTALWTGLRAVEAPFFAMLDDDDTIMPMHFPALLSMALQDPLHCLYYSGVIRVEEELGDFVNSSNFSGQLEYDVPEQRELKFLDRFSLARLVKFDNYIQSNAWIARSSSLDDRLLVDPQMIVVEDMYLYFMLLRKGTFKLSPSPTAYWHWRSSSRENSMLGVESHTWSYEGEKLLIRLDQEILSNGLSIGDMRRLLGVAPVDSEPTIPMRAARLRSGQATTLSPELLAGSRRLFMHEAEPGGVWTSGRDAQFQLKLEAPAQEITIQINFTAAYVPQYGPQHVELLVNGTQIFSAWVSDRSLRTATARISNFPASSSIFFRVRCAYTYVPRDHGESGDERCLGVYLTAIQFDELASSVSAEASA